MDIKFISWNVNGLRAVAGKGFADIFVELDADFVCLQETKMQPDQAILDLPGYKQYWNNPRGSAFYRITEMQTTHNLKRKLMVCTHYVSSSIICRNWRFLQESPEKLLTLLCIPSGLALYLLIRHKVKHNSLMKFNKRIKENS